MAAEPEPELQPAMAELELEPVADEAATDATVEAEA